MKKGILLVAYGLANSHAEESFYTFYKRARSMFSFGVRHAFSSERSRVRLAIQGSKSDSTLKALKKMIFEGYTHIYVQSFNLICGLEYLELKTAVAEIARTHSVALFLAKPLLEEEEFYPFLVKALAEKASLCDRTQSKEDTALVYMAHGSRDKYSTDLYIRLAVSLQEYDNRIFFSCLNNKISQELSLENLLSLLEEKKYKQILLFPFFSLAGIHVTKDMAGEHKESWKSRFEEAGFTCQAHCNSLLSEPAFIELWLQSIKQLTLYS